MANNGYLKIYEHEKGIDPKLLEVLKEKVDYEKSIWNKYQTVEGNRISLESQYVRMIDQYNKNIIKPKLEKLFEQEIDYYYVDYRTTKKDEQEEYYFSLNHLPTNKVYSYVAKWAIPPLWHLLFRKDDIIRDINYLNLETNEQISKEEYDKLEDRSDYVHSYSFLYYETTVKKAIKNIKEYIGFFEEHNSLIRDNEKIVEEINKDENLKEKYEIIKYYDIKEMLDNLLNFHPESHVSIDYAEICMMLNLDYISNANPAGEMYEDYKETHTRVCNELREKIKKFKTL